MKIIHFHLYCCTLALLAQPTYADTAQTTLFGNWGGARSDLAAKGIDVKAHHIFDVYDDFSGAADDGTAYFGRLRVAAEFDLEQLLGWEASYLSISGVHQYGKNYNRSRFAIFTNPSSIEGNDTTRMANIYFGQNLLDGALSYKIGKVDGVGEFGAQDYGGTFMNDEFAYVPNALFTSGLPFDPAQKLGLVVTYTPFEQGLYFKGGIFDSNNLDAYQDDDHGLSFDWQGAVAYAAEVGYRSDPGATSKPGFIKLGAHYNTDQFAHYLNGGSNGYNYLIYLNAGQTLVNFDREGTRHLDASFTWAYAPEDRNLYANEFTALLRAVGPTAGRPDDELGIGLVAAFISDDYSTASVLGGGPPSSEEYTVELTYKAAVTPWLDLQPSLQAVVNPAGNTSRDTVWIAGLRTVITF